MKEIFVVFHIYLKPIYKQQVPYYRKKEDYCQQTLYGHFGKPHLLSRSFSNRVVIFHRRVTLYKGFWRFIHLEFEQQGGVFENYEMNTYACVIVHEC